MRIRTLPFLLIPVLMSTADTGHGTTINLCADPAGWKTWVQRPEVAPDFEMKKVARPGENPSFIIDSRGDRDAFGCWRHPLTTLRKGRTYRIEAAFEPQGIDRVDRRVWAIISNGENQFQELNHEGGHAAVRRMSAEFTVDKDYDQLTLRLYLAWAPGGSVRWRDGIIDIGTEPDQRRAVKLAAVSGRPKQGSTFQQALEFDLKRLDEAGTQRVDLVCLPELVNTDRVATEPPDDRTTLAEPLPGGSFYSALAAKVREHRMYIAACLLERNGRRIYMQTRALDNQVHIVASVNQAGQTCIVTPRGEIVARADKAPGSLAIAVCDLSAGVRDGSGREIEGRYMCVRRADTFAPLLRDYSERRRDVDVQTSQSVTRTSSSKQSGRADKDTLDRFLT